MAQNCMLKTSTILYSIPKGIFKIYQLEREQWLCKVIQKYQSSIIYSFIFMSENDKNVSLNGCDFHTK